MGTALDSTHLRYEINESIPIYNGQFAIIDSEQQKLIVKGKVLISFLPNPKLSFEGEVIDNVNFLFPILRDFLINKDLKLMLLNGMNPSIFVTNQSHGETSKIQGIIKEPILESDKKDVEYIRFGLVNFVNDFGRSIDFECMSYLGRLVFSNENWEMILDKRHDYGKIHKDLFNNLKENGGYAITHLGELRNKNGKSFCSDDCELILESLQWLLSFAAGRRVGICTLEGYQGEELVWTRYQVPSISTWKSNITWFPKQKSNYLQKLLPEVFEKFKDPFWKKVLNESLNWYIESNGDSFVESKVVSTQVALETLAWVDLIIDKKIMGKNKYDELSASEKIRLLLTQMNIGFELPEKFKAIGKPLDDGPQLFTTLRNDTVHPTRTPQFQNNKSRFDILQLGIWYLEMVLLRILGYDGVYLNRLKIPVWEGNYDMVPWGKKQQKNIDYE